MKKKLKVIFFSFLLFLLISLIISSEDPAWVECSDENDLYRYVHDGWKVDKVLKDGDINFGRDGTKYIYKHEFPQIWLSKGNEIKALNFGWRCYYLEGAELHYIKSI